MRRLYLTLSVFLFAGCLPPPVPVQTLADSAYDLNVAARFGRMDIALDGVSQDARTTFARTHDSWGQTLRVLDVEMIGMEMTTRSDANVVVDVSWQRMDESLLRKTRLLQHFRDERGTWRLLSEEQIAGDDGLIEDPSPKKTSPIADAPPRPAVSLRRPVLTAD